MEIKFFNRYKDQVEVEKVYGDSGVKFLYQSSTGKSLAKILTTYWFSKLYGFFQNLHISQDKIVPFVKSFNIDLKDFLPEKGRDERSPYSSFNTFFIRKYRPGLRDFVKQKEWMPAFSEARYFGYETVLENEKVPVKGKYLCAKELLKKEEWIDTFSEGPLLLARLCPVDYHRFHYPDNGKVLDYYPVRGKLHSVNPIALKEVQDIFSTNERVVTILETENFGKLAFIEVGAICVGKIVQSGSLDNFSRGDEKGYFLFGGSTVIVLGEKGKWKPSQDILNYTKKGVETYIHLGDQVAQLNT